MRVLIAFLTVLGLSTPAFADCDLGKASDYENRLREIGALINAVPESAKLEVLEGLKDIVPGLRERLGDQEVGVLYLVNVVDYGLKDHPYIVLVDTDGCIMLYFPISISNYNALMEATK